MTTYKEGDRVLFVTQVFPELIEMEGVLERRQVVRKRVVWNVRVLFPIAERGMRRVDQISILRRVQ